MATTSTVPPEITDPVNARILEISEDQLQGFHASPFREIAERSGVPLETVLERIRAMLEAGVIRRVRQTLITTSLAPGALVAWKVPNEQLSAAFEHLHREDPFSGHIVIRTTDQETEGGQYRLWTTLKVPVGFSMQRHCEVMADRIGAEAFRIMPAKKLFKLGVGHMRRRGLPPGARSDEPAAVMDTEVVELTDHQWRVLTALKRELEPGEIRESPWSSRAEEAGISLDELLSVGRELEEMGVVGRFSTFLEHVKPSEKGTRVTRYNGLFHWRVPEGREIEAGREVGRHHVITHAYWREGGPAFGDVNVMAVAHGMEKEKVLEHKAAIDRHLEEAGIPVSYTNVFWGGRSEITPSEISPLAYVEWCRETGLNPEEMRE